MVRVNIIMAVVLLLCFSVRAQDKKPIANEITFKKHCVAYEEGNVDSINFWINNIALAKSKFQDLDGEGITIGLKENAPDVNDPDIGTRIKQSSLTSSSVSQHATTLATLLVGQGISSPNSAGIVPRAMLVPIAFSNLSAEPIDFYQSRAISVVNHSYGTNIENFYSEQARTYDASVVTVPSLLQIFSAGNQGYSSGTGLYAGLPGFANITGSFKQSKNTLTVGAVGGDRKVFSSSSSGPAYDGRIKPEVCAFSDEGTSGASALASGVAAMMQQCYFKLNQVSPDAALIKSILINSADDVEATGPDWKSGYGSINAFRAIKTIEAHQYIKGVILSDEKISIEIPVPLHAKNLKVTLTWTDPAATTNSENAIVNDLDLEVQAGEQQWLPWTLNSYPHIDSLSKRAIRGHDHLNTTEQVTIEDVNDKLLSIFITSHSIVGEQTFYIAYQWDMQDTFLWTAPVQQTYVNQSDTFIVRWESTFDDEQGTLEISTDEGITWNLVEDNIALSSGTHAWQTPLLFSSVKLRMVVKGNAFLSEEFKIGPLVNLTTLYHCSDSVGIKWNTFDKEFSPYNKVRLYQYSTQSEKWIDNGLHVENPIVIKTVNADEIISLAPVNALGEEGIKSSSFFFGNKEVQCFYETFTTILLLDTIEVQCELSFPQGVSYVIFQKNIAGKMISLDTTVVTAENYYNFYDHDLIDGSNTYRAMLKLITGQVVYSDFSTVIYSKEKDFILFPNPVERQDNLNIATNDGSSFTLQIFDVSGKPRTLITLYEARAEVPVNFLQPGLYFYQIKKQNNPPQIGKLLIR